MLKKQTHKHQKSEWTYHLVNNNKANELHWENMSVVVTRSNSPDVYIPEPTSSTYTDDPQPIMNRYMYSSQDDCGNNR